VGSRFWNDVTGDFLGGRARLRPPLDEWRRSYDGTGRGLVDEAALAEPFLGPILGASVCAVFLALNPGVSQPEF
jgi:hypothetical protein